MMWPSSGLALSVSGKVISKRSFPEEDCATAFEQKAEKHSKKTKQSGRLNGGLKGSSPLRWDSIQQEAKPFV